MTIRIDVQLDYALPAPTDCLVQIKAARTEDQTILWDRLEVNGPEPSSMLAEDGVGERLWVHAEHALSWRYSAEVQIGRDVADIGTLRADAPSNLPPNVVKYLFPSRFCPSDKFLNYVGSEFGHLSGGAMVVAMRDFVRDSFAYVPGSSNAETSALETFVLRQGVCRDYAHMLVTLVRAGTVPARLASVYGIGVTPQDFHAVAEVWLEGRWHLVDPSWMAHPFDMAHICVGRDATDVAFLTTYGLAELRSQSVQVWAG